MFIGQVPACPGGTLYTIRPGDTLFALASRFGTTVTAILAANPGIVPTNLQVGQVICIPAPVPVSCPDGTVAVYTVQPGDTLYLIARRFGVPLQTLIAANPGVDPLRLQIGQAICIPGVVPPTVAPCCRTLTPVAEFPLTQLPFTPAGVILIQPAGAGFTAVATAAFGLPDPETFGQFDAYEARLIFPPPRAMAVPEIIGLILAPARSFEQPVVWAGSRVIQRLLTEETTVVISPFNTGTGFPGNPILRGTAGPCR